MNIVFIGLPGCGKTVVSRQVACRLDRLWYDSDSEIEASEGMGIPEIFAQKGEAYFREAETRCLERLTGLDGAVLSAGGGAVLQNSGLIARNSVVVYVKRPLEAIRGTLEPGTRPLLKDSEKLHELYEQRRGIYESLANITVDNDGEVHDAAKKVLRALRQFGI